MLATGGIGKSFKVTVELLGVHRRRARAGAAGRRHAGQHGVRPVPPDRHGLAAERQGHPRHRVGARRRRRPEELRGQAVHVRLRPRRVPQAVRRDRGGGRPLVRRPGQQPPPARAAAPRRGRPRDQLRGQGRPRVARTAVSSSTSPRGCRPRRSASGCRRCTTSSRSWPTSTSPTEPMEVGPTCHYVMGGVEVDPDTGGGRPCPACSRPARCAGGMHGSNRLGGNSLSDLLVFGRRAGLAPRRLRRRARRRPARGRRRRRRRGRRGPRSRRSTATGGENPYTVHQELQQTMNDLVGIIRTAGGDRARRSRGWRSSRRGRRRCTVEGDRQFNPGWHLALDLRNMLLVSECVARAALMREESRGGHTRDDFPEMSAGVAQGQPDLRARRRRRCSVDSSRCRRCRPSCSSCSTATSWRST